MKQSSARLVTFSAFALGLALHVFCIMPYVSGILTDVPPQPYRNWELLNQGVNYFFIAAWIVGIPLNLTLISEWIVGIPLNLTLISEWIYDNLGVGAR